jgi:hypothetical protein
MAPMYGAEGLRFAQLEAGMIGPFPDEGVLRCGLGWFHVAGVDSRIQATGATRCAAERWEFP